jgi:NAD(P)-dependent dehydrogenase (short-subunit alcohol dehydrogenase family)
MVSSVSGIITPPTHGPYSSSKHAMEGLSNALRLEMYPFEVEVIFIQPGYIVTNRQSAAAELMEPYADKITAGPYARISRKPISAASSCARKASLPGNRGGIGNLSGSRIDIANASLARLIRADGS